MSSSESKLREWIDGEIEDILQGEGEDKGFPYISDKEIGAVSAFNAVRAKMKELEGSDNDNGDDKHECRP